MTITFETVQTAKNTKIMVRMDDGQAITEKKVTPAQMWKIEISCSKAGWTSAVKSEIAGNAIYNKITWKN